MKVKKTAIVYHKSDLDGVVSAAIATMYEHSKNKDVVYVLDVSFGADSKNGFQEMA